MRNGELEMGKLAGRRRPHRGGGAGRRGSSRSRWPSRPMASCGIPRGGTASAVFFPVGWWFVRPHPSGADGQRMFGGRGKQKWRDDRCVVRFFSRGMGPRGGAGIVGRHGGRPSMLPVQGMHFALVGPGAGVCRQTGADGIFGHILPLFRVALFFSQLGVPKVPLPNGGVLPMGPVPR